MANKTAMNTDMVNINQETLFNKAEFSYLVPVENVKHIHPYIKSSFCARKISKCAFTRKVRKLYRELENSDKRHRNSAVSRGLYISQNSSTEKHPKLSQLKSGRTDSSTEGNSHDVEQGGHCGDPKPLGRGIYQQHFLLEKKGGEPSSNNLETPKSVHT